MASVVGKEHDDLNSNSGRALCISLYVKTFGKDINPVILPLAI